METITQYLPEIGGVLLWLALSAFNYATKHHSEVSPGWRQVLAKLTFALSFLDRSGWFKVLKMPLVHWPKPETAITDIPQGQPTTPGKEKSE